MKRRAPNQNETDLLILVDDQDRAVGNLQKIDCHLGIGKLHRAFSVFLFDSRNRLLLQKRSRYKMLWPGYWTNSCCSHPRAGETTLEAAHRRVKEELGASCWLQFVYKFVYYARYGEVGAEYENCSVFVGRLEDEVEADPVEIAAIRWMTAAELAADIAARSAAYTPWFKLEWEQLTKDDCRHTSVLSGSADQNIGA